MLRVSSLSKAIGGVSLFDNLSFVVNPGECMGIVGPNGSGKTTLLRIIAGMEPAGDGSVSVSGDVRLPLLPQGIDATAGGTVGEHFPHIFGASVAEARLETIAIRMAEVKDEEEANRLAAEYDRALAALTAAPPDGDGAGLILPGVDAETPVAILSGGEIERLALLDLLATHPPVLLLDEPTNHLDLDALEWLEQRVRTFSGPVVVVSHDRAFLDAVATSILSLDPAAGHEHFAGNYSAFAEHLERRRARQWDDFHRQQREERALKREISAIESRARNIENRTIDFYVRKRAAKVARRAVTLKSRMSRELESAERVERPSAPPIGFRARAEQAPASASVLCRADNLELCAGERTLIRNATFAVGRGDRVALVGPNGSGKSTLFRAILGRQPVAAGALEVSGSAVIGFLEQDDASSDFAGDAGSLTPVDWIRRYIEWTAPEAANELHRFLGDHQVLETPIRSLSYGERRRLALARLVLTGVNLLLLDEPTNHLDLPAREAFERVLGGYDGAVVIATHDRYLVERFASRTLAIEEGRLVEG